MKPQLVHLGYEVGTGEPVSIPINHLCVTGQTQMSGKTTAMEALIMRSNLKAIAFVTKRGESAFSLGRPTQPFFRNRAGWQFVSEVLGAVLNEKLKWERYWIMHVSRGAKSLTEVYENTKRWLADTKKSQDTQILTTMVEYFDLFMPELSELPYTSELDLAPGLNVMDLGTYSTPLQMLVISSVVQEIYKHQKGVITVVPEAWEFIPQGKSSPAKSDVEDLIRKGGSLRNFLFLDSQDISGVEKTIVRQCPLWLFGVQREHNEIQRTLKQVPGNVKKPKADDIMTLQKGQFIVCYGTTVIRTYAQPIWLNDKTAIKVATGELDIETIDFGRSAAEAGYGVDLGKWQNTINEVRSANKAFAVKEGGPIISEAQEASLMGSHGYSHPMIVDNRPAGVISKERQEIERMDQAERQRYETTIQELRKEIEELRRQLPGRSFAKEHSADEARPFTQAEASRGPCWEPAAQGPGTSGALIYEAERTVGIIIQRPDALQALASALIPLLPSNGRVVIEAREVVLKQYQAKEVERILSRVESLSPWKKEVLRYVEAQNRRCEKAEILKALKGKAANQVANYKDLYAEIDQLANAGWLKRDSSGRPSPNLKENVVASLANFTPSQQEVDDLHGQVLLRLKP